MSQMYWKIKITPVNPPMYAYYPVEWFHEPENAIADAKKNNPGTEVTCEGKEYA